MSQSVESFANWFRCESERLRGWPSRSVAEEVANRLAQIDSRIGLEVEYEPHGRNRELILTAFSDPTAFPLIDRITAAIGDVSGWTIVALKQPRGFGFSVTMAEKKVRAVDLRFQPMPGIVNGFQIVVPGVSVAGEGAEEMAWLIVETGIGERLAGRIQHLEFGSPDSTNTRPISELAACVE